MKNNKRNTGRPTRFDRIHIFNNPIKQKLRVYTHRSTKSVPSSRSENIPEVRVIMTEFVTSNAASCRTFVTRFNYTFMRYPNDQKCPGKYGKEAYGHGNLTESCLDDISIIRNL